MKTNNKIITLFAALYLFTAIAQAGQFVNCSLYYSTDKWVPVSYDVGWLIYDKNRGSGAHNIDLISSVDPHNIVVARINGPKDYGEPMPFSMAGFLWPVMISSIHFTDYPKDSKFKAEATISFNTLTNKYVIDGWIKPIGMIGQAYFDETSK